MGTLCGRIGGWPDRLFYGPLMLASSRLQGTDDRRGPWRNVLPREAVHDALFGTGLDPVLPAGVADALRGCGDAPRDHA